MPPNRRISLKELARHNTPDDCWLLVKGKVYDVSGWGKGHPGGAVIYTHGGKARACAASSAVHMPPCLTRLRHQQDATDVFSAFHSPQAWQTLRSRQIGTCTEEAPRLLEDFRAMRTEMQSAGLFQSSKAYYAFKVRPLCACPRSRRRA